MPFKSPFPDIDIPELDIWSLLFEKPVTRVAPSQKIFTDSNSLSSYTYNDLQTLSPRIGRSLFAAFPHLKPGARVGFLSLNDIDTGLLTLATLWGGLITCPANPSYTVGELVHQMGDSSVELMFASAAAIDVVTVAAKKVGLATDRIIVMGAERKAGFRHWRDILEQVEKSGKCQAVSRPAIDHYNDIACIVYSSGTTGLPKGVLLTHRNMVSNMLQMRTFDGITLMSGWDKGTAIIPFFHIYGLNCTLLSAIITGTEVFVFARFDLAQTLQLIQDQRITYMYVPPPIILLFAKHPLVEKYDLKSLRWINSGAAPLTRDLAEAVWDRLHIGTKQGYGMSESSPVITLQRIDDWRKAVGSVGPLVPNMWGKIVDENGNELPAGETGELMIKGPNVFKGYLNLEKQNSELFVDGYMRTGDVAYLDNHGNIFITDRAKELIKYKGFQVAPAELEGLLLSRSDINDVCIIGVHDDSLATEVPRAYIVLKDGVTPSEDLKKDIAEWMGKRVANYKKLRGGICWTKEIPKSSTGKILRRIVKDMDRKASSAQGPKL